MDCSPSGLTRRCPALKKVAKFVNEGNLDGAASKIKEYNKAEVPVKDKKTGKVRKVKKVRPGLVIRRGQEAQLVDGEKTTAQLLGKGGGGTGSGGGRDCSKDDLNSPPSRGATACSFRSRRTATRATPSSGLVRGWAA